MTLPVNSEFDYGDELEPEEVLHSVYVLLKNRNNSTEGWISLLNNPDISLDAEEIKQNILMNVGHIRLVLAKAKEYIDKRASQ